MRFPKDALVFLGWCVFGGFAGLLIYLALTAGPSARAALDSFVFAMTLIVSMILLVIAVLTFMRFYVNSRNHEQQGGDNE